MLGTYVAAVYAFMFAFESIVAGFTTGTVLDVILGTFITTTSTESCFTICNWYIFVAVTLILRVAAFYVYKSRKDEKRKEIYLKLDDGRY